MSFFRSSAADELRSPRNFEVRLIITDLDNQPLPQVEGRLVLGAIADWQNAQSGLPFVTGTDGKTVMRIPAVLDMGTRKRPTNFLSSLVAGKEATDDLQIAVELAYADDNFLYVAKVHRFRCDGTVLLGEVRIFSRDSLGHFTVAVPRNKEGSWLLPQFPGMAVTMPGHEIADFLFWPDESDASGNHWILNCQFKRAPAPVMR